MDDFANSQETIEFAYIVKALCDAYGISQGELSQFGSVHLLWKSDCPYPINRIRQIPIKVSIPSAMASTAECNRTREETLGRCLLDITSAPNPSWGDDPREMGLYEFALIFRGEVIRFWRCKTYSDYNGPLGRIIHFVEKKNLKKFYRAILQIKRRAIRVKVPVLDQKVLLDIWNNSIEFLENSEKNGEQYKEHNIPCKRGILLSGSPGCVLGDTIIKIRKKTDKGIHSIHDV